MAKVILVPRTMQAMFGGSSLPVNEMWPTGLPPVMSMSGMSFPIPQSQKTVNMPVMSLTYDAWMEQAPWYGIKTEFNFQGFDIDNRMWDRQEFRRRPEECECEIVLVQPTGAHFRIGWSDGAAFNAFHHWFNSQEKKHKFKTMLPASIHPSQIEQWLKDHVNGPYHYHQLGGNNGAVVLIKDEAEAFHYEMRWRLPKEEPA